MLHITEVYVPLISYNTHTFVLWVTVKTKGILEYCPNVNIIFGSNTHGFKIYSVEAIYLGSIIVIKILEETLH